MADLRLYKNVPSSTQPVREPVTDCRCGAQCEPRRDAANVADVVWPCGDSIAFCTRWSTGDEPAHRAIRRLRALTAALNGSVTT